MDTTRQDAARTKLKGAIQKAGGTVKVAAEADVPQTHLSSVLSGKRDLGKETAVKLRQVVDLAAEDWLDLLAPIEGDGAAVQS